jgi:uncharacterized membrane protein YkvA (DUF1232 family)
MPQQELGWMQKWRTWARGLRREIYALYLAYRHPDTPWYARWVAALVAAYAFSPIDLVPDFIPVLGYLDDLLLLPLGIALAIKLVPPQVMQECRAQADQRLLTGHPVNRAAALVIVLVWIIFMGLLVFCVWRQFFASRMPA